MDGATDNLVCQSSWQGVWPICQVRPAFAARHCADSATLALRICWLNGQWFPSGNRSLSPP